jgi:type VI secretion system protein ImpB
LFLSIFITFGLRKNSFFFRYIPEQFFHYFFTIQLTIHHFYKGKCMVYIASAENQKTRIKITLDLATNGSTEKKELPLKLLIMGKFTAQADQGLIGQRKKLNVRKDNLDQVMQKLLPTLKLEVPNYIQKTEHPLYVEMIFRSLQDFHPRELVMQIPLLKKLMAMRNLLKELKANLLENQVLKNELDKLVAHPQQLLATHQELKQLLLTSSIQESHYEKK